VKECIAFWSEENGWALMSNVPIPSGTALVEMSAYRELESKLARIYKSVEKLNAANKKYESLRMSPSLVFGAVNKLCALVDKERGWQTTG
jgi:hypothetical protein